MYRGDKKIKGHANLVAVDNSKNAMRNAMASSVLRSLHPVSTEDRPR